mmetsp:Transcript_539/g.910  ORF Transcript_539/g.910 Transcript_539/m.910 type:complete len:156 (+) Transcript_539:857-1324(+)|eukprot:CAMPEP_0184315882 /NCGR_PEP_ID=MMETSP1049-20130417/86428_1 /TAXON_ID=77928 /ORGANISM="Proteomonas sulcata, Strain CCMP704" /LENGTH=155 /DNA_ID=CAMNT_0026634609 /DNA_START=836 /DNA_END=1303 /DNA_ORIENTATION=+
MAACATNRNGVELRSSKLAVAGMLRRKQLSFESLDLVDFGAPASAEGGRQLNKVLVSERLTNHRNVAKACSFRCSEVKDHRKRWNEDKVSASSTEVSEGASKANLAEHLADRQPVMSKIVSRCQPEEYALTEKAGKAQGEAPNRGHWRRAKRQTS